MAKLIRLFTFAVALLLPAFVLSAQTEWTYVVTGKAGKDGVQAYTVSGYPVKVLNKGDEITVSAFYDDFPMWDGSGPRKAVVFTEMMEDYVILLDEEGIIVPKSKYRYERFVSGLGDIVNSSYSKSYLAALFGVIYLVLMFFGVDGHPGLGRIHGFRDLLEIGDVRPNAWVLRGVSGWVFFGVYLATLAGESYFLLTSGNPFWFMSFSEVGVLKGLLFLVLMIIYLYAKLTVTCVALYPLKQTRLLEDSNFNYRTAVLIAVVGTWLALSMTYWKSGITEYLMWGVAIATLAGVIWVMRKALRQAGILLSVLMVVVVLAGGASLCYVICEVLAKIIQVVLMCFAVYAVFSALGSSSSSSEPEESDYATFVDWDGNSHNVYRQPDGTYKDYSDNTTYNRVDGANGPRFEKIG